MRKERAAIVCFTNNGLCTAWKTAELVRDILEPSVYFKSKKMSDTKGCIRIETDLPTWSKEQFSRCDALIFVGATGIAVRSIAPWVQDKRYDPAVLVIDEKGAFCIPLLSGHIGGANALAEKLAKGLNGTAVLTTATDVNHRFAVDVFAVKNHLQIGDMQLAKEVSAALLAGEQVGFSSEFPVHGILPEGLVKISVADRLPAVNIHIGIHRQYPEDARVLYLIPRCLTIGIGCRKGTAEELIQSLVNRVLEENRIFASALSGVASIDLKKEEPGLISFCRKRELPFETFSAEELQAIPGTFTGSGFVRKITGVDNVCERAALAASGGALWIKKQSASGVTCACAGKEWSVEFE